MTKSKILLIGVIILFILVAAWFMFECPPFEKCPGTRPLSGPPPPVVVLTMVGPWDSANDWKDVSEKFNAYKKKQENGYLDVLINYKKISDQANYEDIIREMQFEGKGPNIFMLFNSWIPRYQEKLLPVPAKMMDVSQFKNTFAQVTVDDLMSDEGTIYALPFYIDTPALYYNEDRFINEGFLNAPQTWDEFKNYTEKLTILDENGNIEKAGAAFGGGSNVNRSQDIILLLAMQNNYRNGILESEISIRNPETISAIKFYTDFTDPAKRFYTWNEDQIYSIDAFTQRKATMMINYSHHIDNVTTKTGGILKFKIAPVPQFDKNYKVNYATYWVPAVPKIAPCKSSVSCYDLAWEYLNFAAKKENVGLYLDATNRASANLQLAQEQASDSDDARSVFASQVLTAKSWPRYDDKAVDKVLLEMLDSIITNDENKKKTIEQAANYAASKIRSLD
ncbi:MAG: extracellular solute-binding protein [Candidatus Pacebacteria bacterium]|nr:extracellular solute-binding protein [Candidatus Paceibacterota bacterium]